jgi:hypothetical protein
MFFALDEVKMVQSRLVSLLFEGVWGLGKNLSTVFNDGDDVSGGVEVSVERFDVPKHIPLAFQPVQDHDYGWLRILMVRNLLTYDTACLLMR